ncbi:hypothetical protein [Streptomyces torulosus]|uniref:nSTAND1 domain-containing NTPase n=1 Tax=Streptomyces torulosus TaxID=68276 RepID=UPI0006EB4BFD|nr:hypothetical protein [Streptomyces torulosus]
MGRRERDLDPEAGPLQRFAQELRQLREKAGGPSYRELSKRAHYSVTALSEAAGGVTLPSLAVTLAYVAACGGDREAWEARWRAVVDEVVVPDEPSADESETSPYRGLSSFEPHHSEWFFGRQELMTELCSRVDREPLLAVFGASGSGKSSLLRAGLLPRVRTGAVPGGEGWTTILLTPGRHPIEELAARLAHLLGVPATSLCADLTADPKSIGVLWRQALVARPGTKRVLLVVDQFEEIFTLCGDPQERGAFIDSVVASTVGQDDRIRTVLGIRADFFAQCARYPELVGALRDRQVLVGPMEAADLRCVVREPALRAGMKVEAALVEAVVADTHGEPGALPLVSHALYETWKRRSGNTMALARYRLAGGVQGAIAQSAERVYAELDEAERSLAKNVFLRLTALGQGTEDTRRRVTREELLGGADHTAVTTVVSRLAAARLVTLGTDTVEVAHEALIRSWPRLRTWLTEDREELAAHRRLTDTAAEWEKHGRDEGMLYRGVRLAEWDNRKTDRLNELEHEFLAASRHRAQAERTAARRRVRLTVGGLTAAVVALAVLAFVALAQARRAEAGQELAFARQLVASARSQAQLDPELGLLLANRAYRTSATDETEAALRQAVFESRVRAVLHSHEGQILGVSFSPDGRHVATSGGDGAIRVWRYGRTLRDPLVLRGHDGEVWTPVFSRDGKRIAAAGVDGTVSVWEWASGAKPVILRGHASQVWSVAFSRDGRRVAGAGDDGTVRIWNSTGTGEPVVLRGHDGRTLGVSFSPDGRRLAGSGGDGTVRIWDVASRRTTVVLRGHGNSVEALAYSPDGQRIVTASTDGTVRLWDPDAPTESVVLGSHDGTAEWAGFSRDGTRVASTGNDGTVRIWNVRHRASPLILRGHRGTVTACAFAPDGRRLVSVSEDGTARIWEAAPTGSDRVLTGHKGPVWATVPSRDGRRLASASADGTVRVWRTGSTAPPTVLRGHDGEVLGVGFSPDGRRVAGTGTDGTTRIWPVDNATKPVVLRGHDGAVWTADFSPDGRRLVTGGTDGTVRIWTATGRGAPVVVDTGQGSVRYVAYSPDGRRVAAAGLDGTIHILDAATGDERKVLRGHNGLVWSVAFSPDGRRLVSGGNDGTARLWDLTGRSEPRVLTGHQGLVWSVAFGPDGRLVATSGNDATTRIWRTTDSSPPVVLHGFGASVENTNFLAGNRFVSSHDDGTVRVWTCLPCEPIDEVVRRSRDHITREFTPEERAGYLNEPAG